VVILGNVKAARVLEAWGLNLSSRPITLEGRTLDPENIILGKRTVSTNTQCDWTRDFFNGILVAVQITTWLLVCSERDILIAQDFIKSLKEFAYQMGINIDPPKVIILKNDRTETYVDSIRNEIHPTVGFYFFFVANVSLFFSNNSCICS